MFRPMRALLIWADGRVDEDISVRSILLNVSWNEETLGLDGIYALTESYSEVRVTKKPITAIFSR